MSALIEQFGSGDALARAESWRYSRQALRALEQQDFTDAVAASELPPTLLARFDWPQTRGRRLVFVNGVLARTLSDAATEMRLVATADNHVRIVLDHAAPPLHLVQVNLPGATPMRWQARLDIHLAAGEAQLVEQHLGAPGAVVLGALTSAIDVAQGAHLRVTTLSDLADNIALYRRSQIKLEDQSRCTMTHALFGGRMQRIELDVALAAAQAHFVSNGTFALRAREHVDVHLQVLHDARDTQCAVSWRGVADQRARGIFHGAITVAPGADGTDARLQTHNLLLSEHAEIDAQPVLEIHADEVKAAHGATVGKLDERALFYLRSRGVPLAAARSLLIAAFCREAFIELPDAALRELLDATLLTHLPQGVMA
jgi:Fe-S cluster assembly protein SufD